MKKNCRTSETRKCHLHKILYRPDKDVKQSAAWYRKSELPILRVEAGAHSATINGISTDAKGHFVATVSNDKTARLYEVGTGRLVHTFRPLIGGNFEGRLNTIALSPDAKTLAMGGVTGRDTMKDDTYTYSIYIFNTASGRLVQRISGLPEAVMHLTYSPDGHFLAVGLGAKGIRIFSSIDGREIGRDTEYGDASFSVHFASDGRLVSSSDDGYIRLYERPSANNPLKLIAKIRAPGGNQPMAARFSPNGTRIAVGYFDTPKVNVFNSADLSLLFSADTSALSAGSLGNVAWSADGSTLFAGRYSGTNSILYRWRNEGSGKHESVLLEGTGLAILGLAPLPNGDLLIAVTGPTINMMEAKGQIRIFAKSPIADFRNINESTKISTEGSKFHFGFEASGKSPYYFDLTKRILSPLNNSADRSSLHAPITSFPGIDLDGTPTEPKLNGIPVKLKPGEQVTGGAISADGKRILLVSQGYLRCFSQDGEEQWNRDTSVYIQQVNIAPDGRVAVASYSDGTIRWHQMSDGRELLAFFPHADRKRWVLWTPEGFFDHSPGGEELIGFHLNRGKDREADFIPVSKLYNQFYRSDLINAAFEGKYLTEYAKAIDIDQILSRETIPPTVHFLTKSGNADNYDTQIRAQVCDTGGGIGDVTLFLNDMPVAVETAGRGLKVVEKNRDGQCYSFERTITLSPGANNIQLMAYNKANTIESHRDTIEINHTAKAAQPELHLLTVAVNAYRDGDLRLKYALPDADALAEQVQAKGNGLFNKVHLHTLRDGDVTKEGLAQKFASIGSKMKREDVFLLFVAGHGITDEKEGAYYFLPADFRYTGEGAVQKQAVSMTDFRNMLANVQAMKSLILLDTCNSGSFAEAIASRGMTEKTAITKLSRAVGRATIVASSKSQVALEGYEGHGAFTWTILEGMKGKTADKGSKITINTLATFIEEELPKLTFKKWGYEQIPQKTLQGMDFQIGVR